MKYVMENCTTTAQAQDAVNDLLAAGYPGASLSVIADQDLVPDAAGLGVNLETCLDYSNDDETLWQRIKDFFTVDAEEDRIEDIVYNHRADIENGNILVVVDDTYISDEQRANLASRNNGYWAGKDTASETYPLPVSDPYHTADAEVPLTSPDYVAANDLPNAGDNETIRLAEERLRVDKQNVEAGEVVLKKHVVEENETINVPVRHEEVTIERRPVSDNAAYAGDAFADDTITIPLYEEKVSVTKEPVITEEVRVSKADVEDTRQVSETVRREELDVDKTGDVIFRGPNDKDDYKA